jgi:hypothetical protein
MSIYLRLLIVLTVRSDQPVLLTNPNQINYHYHYTIHTLRASLELTIARLKHQNKPSSAYCIAHIDQNEECSQALLHTILG